MAGLIDFAHSGGKSLVRQRPGLGTAPPLLLLPLLLGPALLVGLAP